MINWKSSENEVLFNPRIPEALKDELLPALSCLTDYNSKDSVNLLSSTAVFGLKEQVCLATSGTSGRLKWTVLSKTAILASAKAVNEHLESDHTDLWLNPLPDFHVGGLGIYARGHVSRARVVACHFPDARWIVEHFFKQLTQSKATLTSLVPAQVFDLVSAGFKAPEALRAVVVGGGALSEKLYFSAVALGWKLLPSYGLTECASQVATAKMGSWNNPEFPLLTPLGHVCLGKNEEGYLKISSESLLTGYIEKNYNRFMLRDPKIGGWFETEDKVQFEGDCIKSVSRGELFIKIGGESVDLLRLEKVLEEEKLALKLDEDVALLALEDERMGYRLHLVAASPLNENIKKLIDGYSERTFPFERLSYVHCVEKIPRSPLGKVLKNELKAFIFQSNLCEKQWNKF